MNEIYIISIVIAISLLMELIKIYAPEFIRKRIDFSFQKKMESYKKEINKEIADYKQEIEKINKELTFNYQRKFVDFENYTKEVHHRYNDIYVTLLKTNGIVSRRISLKQIPTLQDYNENDLKKYCEKLDIPEGKTKELISMLNNGIIRDVITRELEVYVKIKDEKDFRIASWECRNKYNDSLLYLSEEVEKQVDLIISKMIELYYEINKLFIPGITADLYEKADINQSKLREEIEECFKILVKQMRKEISKGYYET